MKKLLVILVILSFFSLTGCQNKDKGVLSEMNDNTTTIKDLVEEFKPEEKVEIEIEDEVEECFNNDFFTEIYRDSYMILVYDNETGVVYSVALDGSGITMLVDEYGNPRNYFKG